MFSLCLLYALLKLLTYADPDPDFYWCGCGSVCGSRLSKWCGSGSTTLLIRRFMLVISLISFLQGNINGLDLKIWMFSLERLSLFGELGNPHGGCPGSSTSSTRASSWTSGGENFVPLGSRGEMPSFWSLNKRISWANPFEPRFLRNRIPA